MSILKLIIKNTNNSISLESNKDNQDLSKIKGSKSYLYYTIRKVKRYVASVTKGLLDKNQYLSSINIDELIKKNFNNTKPIKAPNFKIMNGMYLGVKDILDLSKDIQYGKYNIDLYKKLENILNSKNIKKDDLLKIVKECQSKCIKYLKNNEIRYIGLELKINNKNIFNEGFRIKHGQPDWEKNLQPTPLNKLGYTWDKFKPILDNALNLASILNKLDILNNSMDELGTRFFKLSEKAEKLYLDTKDPIYLDYIHTLLSVFYLCEIMNHKTHMWLNKLWKYIIIVIKHTR